MKRAPRAHELSYLPSHEQLITFDLGLAAALVAKGFELWSLDKSNPRKAQFVFRRTGNIDSVVSDYWANKLSINARTIIESQKMLKCRIYDAD